MNYGWPNRRRKDKNFIAYLLTHIVYFFSYVDGISNFVMNFEQALVQLAIKRWTRYRWLLALSGLFAAIGIVLVVPGVIYFHEFYDLHCYSGIIALIFCVGLFLMWMICQLEITEECAGAPYDPGCLNAVRISHKR